MRHADYDIYYDYIEPGPGDQEGLRELEENISSDKSKERMVADGSRRNLSKYE